MPQPAPKNENEPRSSWLFSRTGLVTAGFLAAIAFLMATGHSAHLLGFSPFLLLLACPLMHIFMHHGHGGHHGHHPEPKPPADVHPQNRKD